MHKPLTLKDIEDKRLETFTRFWDQCHSLAKKSIKVHAKGWHENTTAFWGAPEIVNALENAGAYVSVHGVTSEGDWAITVTWRGDFHRGVFGVMGIDDPDGGIGK